MRTELLGYVGLSALVLMNSCAMEPQWNNVDAWAADSVEVAVDAKGRPLEIEYHISPEMVPAAVHAAMDELHPGGAAVAGEKEYLGNALYWELTKEVGGRKVEAMFTSDGTLHSAEVELAASAVPTAVQQAVASRVEGNVSQWEEIRNSANVLEAYHAKVLSAGKKLKFEVSPDGRILSVVRELPAEIEIPEEL